MKTLAELEIDDEMDLNEIDLESSAESQSISSTETPQEQTNERKRNVFITNDVKYGPFNIGSFEQFPFRSIYRTNRVILSEFSIQRD